MPKKLPAGTEGAAQDWTYTKTQDGRKIVSIRAKGLEQVEGKMKLVDTTGRVQKFQQKYQKSKAKAEEKKA